MTDDNADTVARGEKVVHYRPADLPGTQVLSADRCAHLWRVHHETYDVCAALPNGLPTAAFSDWRYRGKNYSRFTSGWLMLIEPGELHITKRMTAPATFRVLQCPPAMVQQAAAELGMHTTIPHFRQAEVFDPAVFNAFVALHASLEQPASALERGSRLDQALRLLLTSCTEAPQASPIQNGGRALDRAKEFIEVHLANNVSLDAVATAAGLSRYHLVHAFTARFGIPPHAYQTHMRIHRACALLLQGVPLSLIASELGFADHSHFGRHFRRLMRVSPLEYRNGIGRAGTSRFMYPAMDRGTF